MGPFVVVISGAPGSGKTTLGWELSRRLHVPLVSRDDIKTGLHVTNRSDDPSEVWRFAERAFDLFYEQASSYLRAGVSIVVEAAFHAGRSEANLNALAAQMESGIKDVAVYHVDIAAPCLRVNASDGWIPSLDEIANFVDSNR